MIALSPEKDFYAKIWCHYKVAVGNPAKVVKYRVGND